MAQMLARGVDGVDPEVVRAVRVEEGDGGAVRRPGDVSDAGDGWNLVQTGPIGGRE
jgi:hypothetical protein